MPQPAWIYRRCPPTTSSCPSLPNLFDFSGRTRDRIFEFLAQRREELADQMLGHAGQDALTDACDEAADFADTLEFEAARAGTIGNDFEGGAAIAVPEGARARYLDAAGVRRGLVEQRDLAFERTAD